MAKVEFQNVVETDNGNLKNYEDSFTNDAAQCAVGRIHQPVQVSFDTSISMASKLGRSGKTKIQFVCEAINNLQKSEAISTLSDYDKECIDIQVSSFGGDEVIVEYPWAPISFFEGIGSTKARGCTPLYQAIIDALQSVRVMRHAYAESGSSVRRPQVFIFTDGAATDSSFRQQAKKLCAKYASKASNQVKIFIMFVPGEMGQSSIDHVTRDLMDVCDNFTFVQIDDMDNGMPAAFRFLSSSIVVGVSSTAGMSMKVNAKGSGLAFANADIDANGNVDIGTQVNFTKI